VLYHAVYHAVLCCAAQVGGSFVLNCLGESDAEPTMKHFLKRFGAGADRFEVRALVQ
jgi:flavin reductase (DIM6/NTAB) family NADH-FMN oxidoreductase RutF